MITSIRERRLQIAYVLTSAGLVVFGVADVVGGHFLWGFLWYLPVGIITALIVAVGLSLGYRGTPALVVGGLVVAAMAAFGALSPWPIVLPGGELWWWALLAVSIVALVMAFRSLQPISPGAAVVALPDSTPGPVTSTSNRLVPRYRRTVVMAQLVLAGSLLWAIGGVTSSPYEMAGLALPMLIIPLAAVLIAGAAYWSGVRWLVILFNVPFFLVALLGMLGSDLLQGVSLVTLVTVLAGFSAAAALLPPESKSLTSA
jgi:hypothetical protein